MACFDIPVSDLHLHHVFLNLFVSHSAYIILLTRRQCLSSTVPPVDPHAPTFHSVTSNVPENELFGPLEPKDTEWTCAGGFVTETQVFYVLTADGTMVWCQVIHSAVG